MPNAEGVLFADIARYKVEKVPVSSAAAYRMAGVLSAGRGLFSRGEMRGDKTSYPVLHRLSAGQLVMRKLTAWEGPIAVVPASFDGYFVSTEFPTFDLDTQRVRPDYVALLCEVPWLWDEMLARSTGTVLRRKRLNPSGLLAIRVPLPSLAEQDRLVATARATSQYVDALRASVAAAEETARSLRKKHFSAAGEQVSASVLFEIVMGRQRAPKYETGSHVIPYLRAANVKDGRLDLSDVKRMNFTPREQERYRLLAGDVLITEGCGSAAQLGAPAVYRGELAGPVAFQNTLLRVRARPGRCNSAYPYQWARWAFESGGFAALASGTNILHVGSERANAMPVRASTEEERLAFCKVAAAADRVVEAARVAAEAATLCRDALLLDYLERPPADGGAVEADSEDIAS